MSIPKPLAGVAGEWTGTYRLWFSPDDPAIESESTAEVGLVAMGKFLTMRYGWTFDGKVQEGFFLIGVDDAAGELNAQWVDSFHNSNRIMPCRGAVPAADGEVSVLGSYSAPPGPDWGWRTVLEHGAGDTLRMLAFNITPEREEQRAVEVVYRRR
ncbi:MAG TPA: DUF1579 family protein [Gemmatimonadaceae bacterium]|nr:DUF1579 family protein [Gemmatimonadaceae bacterium]